MTTISAYAPYRSIASSKELDLRVELHRLLYGAIDEIAKGKVGLLRRMRRDSDGNLVRCPCRSQATDEPDRDFYCRYCQGSGSFWDEYKVIYFKDDNAFKRTESETQEFERVIFYFEWNVDITADDYIIEVALDKAGLPVIPVTRLKRYDILSANIFRSDGGRAEFWRVRAKEYRQWSVWYGVKNQQHN